MSTQDQVLALVVEDEPAIGSMLVEILEHDGYVALHAQSADAAITQLATVTPALITLDMNLPGISGDELLRLLRQRPETQSIPVIIISAQPTIDDATRQLAQAVISKPFDLDTFLSTVHTLVSPPDTHEDGITDLRSAE